MSENSVEAIVERGVKKYNQRFYDAAIADFDEALHRQPRRADYYLFRACAHRMLGHKTQALADAGRAIQCEPSAPDLRLSAAEIYLEFRLFEEALRECAAALRMRPDFPAALELKSAAQARLGKTQASLRSMREALRLSKKKTETQAAAAEDPAGLPSPPLGSDDAAWAPLVKRLKDLRLALRSRPDDVSRRLEAAALLKHFDECALALQQCDAALAADPACAYAFQLKAALEVVMNRPAAAVKAARDAIGVATAPTQARLWAAEIHKDLDDYEAAIDILEETVREDPASLPALESLAQLKLWRGETSAARKRAEEALALDPRSAPALRALGGSAVLRGRHAEAIKRLDAAISLDARNAEAFLWRGEARRILRQWALAKADIEKAVELGGEVQGTLCNRTLLGIATGERMTVADYAMLVSRVPRVVAGLKTSPGTLVPNVAVARKILKAMQGNRTVRTTFLWGPPGEKKTLRRHVHYFPRDPLLELQATIRFGDGEAVLAEFDRLIAGTPREAYLFASKGEACLWLGRYEETIENLKRALELDPDLPWPNIGLAGANVMLGRYDKGLEHLELAGINHASAEARLTWKGEILRRTGKPELAREIFESTIYALPFKPGVWINLALCCGALGKESEMRGIFAKLKRHFPDLISDGAAQAADGSPMKVLEACLEMMKGNRSSWMHTYITSSGEIKHMKLDHVALKKVPPALTHNRWMFLVGGEPARRELAEWRKAG